MLTTYLNTTEYVFLDADGNSFPDGSPALSVGGKEEVHIFLKKETPNWGAASARPSDWPADTSWASIPGISAMLTVDDDYRKFLPGTVKNAVAAGATSVTCSINDTEDIPVKGIIRIFSATSEIESVYYSGRSVSGTTVTFDLETTVKGEYPAASAMDCTAAPLAQAYLAAGKSNWTTGELVFDLVIDSERLRAENDYKNQKAVTIQGVELLLYSINNNIVQILRSFLLDSASLNNVMGSPGFTAPVPDQIKNEVSAEVERQVEDVADRITPKISENGTWIIDGVDTGKSSIGKQGAPGEAAGFGDPVINVTTGEPGTEASGTVTATGDNTAKVFTINLTIPEGMPGEQGPKGDPMKIDATGTVSELGQYDAEPKGFAFLATDTGMVYIKASDTSGDWSAPVGFQGPAGKDGEDGYTPVRGTDYWTEEDIAEIKAYVDEAILNGAW